MQKSTLPLVLAALCGLLTAPVLAHEPADLRTYQVTIENVSYGQALTPPLIVTHTGDVQLYRVGEAAGPALQAIAENGDLGPLLANLEGNMAVGDMAISEAGPLVPPANPGGTDFASAVTLMLHADARAHSYRSRRIDL